MVDSQRCGGAFWPVTCAVGLLRVVTSERRRLRLVTGRLPRRFPALPRQPGYNTRLRAAGGLLARVLREPARDATFRHDDLWLADSTPVGCGASRDTAEHSDPAGHAHDGHDASHSRWFWGLRLPLVCTPITSALAGAKTDEPTAVSDC
ncbi:hypothetical protein [Cryptosporangium phraense]|uniref:Transposase n=1 Tax=Cryptosporangium phraense TaxID=2593070 RepID=A0A545AQI8_9ACTN|nr:hypothetical protein [Cryptosporangium phraense]TQS42985.1 hypothetical protein FL583_21330 [Cryptosporangium phraense]